MQNATVVSQPSPRTKRPGSRIGPKALLADALLSQGYSRRKIAELVGISPTTVQGLSRGNLVPQAHADAIKRGIRDKCAILADGMLDHVTVEKMQEASVGELTKSARHLIEMAGLAPPSIVESFHLSVQKYVREPVATPVKAEGQ